MGHFLVRSSFYTDGEGAERLAPKEVAGQLLELYYRVITRNGVVRRRLHLRCRAVLADRLCVRVQLAPTYPYNVMLEHVSLGVLGSAVRLVQHLEELRAAHPLGEATWLALIFWRSRANVCCGRAGTVRSSALGAGGAADENIVAESAAG